MTTDSMESIKQTFFLECEDQLSELEAGLLAMQEGRAGADTVNAIFRAVHSIKGGAGAFQLGDLVKFSHAFETVLDQVRSDKLRASSHLMRVMLRAADCLADLVAAARDRQELSPNAWAPVADELRALSDAPGGPPASDSMLTMELGSGLGFAPTPIVLDFPDAAPTSARFVVEFAPRRGLYDKANEAVPILCELARIGTVKTVCNTSTIPLLDALDSTEAYLSWVIDVETIEPISAIQEAFEFVDGDCSLTITSLIDQTAMPDALNPEFRPPEGSSEPSLLPLEGGQSAVPVEELTTVAPPSRPDRVDKTEVSQAQAQPTIRVDFERVDRLINLVGELVINQAMLSQRVIEAGIANSPSVAMGLDELEQLTREIQESVMAIRAQPVRPLFQRMSRIAREVADATSKVVRLKTEGDATEIDKTVVERLADPLTHMIRNAIDHGIELPEVRLAAGKPAEGAVRLTAGHKSGRVVIEVADDGAGINRPRVKSIAIEKGLIPADVQLTDTEIDNLLFLPGFSTASTVSSISGRGVGMDVVKRSIQALGGRISISSRPGLGSTFTLSLPLTLAVLDGMVVAVNGQTFVVPLTAIVETIKPTATSVHMLGAEACVIAIRDGFLPLIDVGRELGIRAALEEAHSGVAILVETEGGARNALLVDSIQDQRQVVIKSLEANYGQTTGVAAATILGDGRVALILDVEALVTHS